MKINWHVDTNAGFDVAMIGGGSVSADGTWVFGSAQPCLSPSGLWLVCSGDTTTWDPGQQAWTVVNGGGGVYQCPPNNPVPPPFLAYQSYHAGFVQNDIVWLATNTASNGNWSGQMTYRVIATDPADVSTWQWVTRYWGASPSRLPAPTDLHAVGTS